MSGVRRNTTVGLINAAIAMAILSLAAVSASAASNKLGFEAQFGKQGKAAGEFEFPYGVAVGPAPGDDVYVSDRNNARVQEFTAAGVFVHAFGEPGAAAGQLDGPESIAVDQATGDVYVLDSLNQRIEEYTGEGAFVQTIGSALKTGSPSGNLMSFGGPEDSLYVGVEGGVLEFDKTSGKQVEEISKSPLTATSETRAIAADPAGDVYVVYNQPGGSIDTRETVHEFSAAGDQTDEFSVPETISAVALDPFGRLAITEFGSEAGFLYSATGTRLGEFRPPHGMSTVYGIGFNAQDELYVADAGDQDVEIYAPITVAEPVTGACREMSATGLTLAGEVNPKGLTGEETRAWFEYGTSTTLGSASPKQNVGEGSAFVDVDASLDGLRPNQLYYYRLVAEDENNREPEPPLNAETMLSCATSPLRPAVGAPEAFDVTFSSVVLADSLNPENARTEYSFQYGPCPAGTCSGSCTGMDETPTLESTVDGQIGVRQTVSALKSATRYCYRLQTVNEHHEETLGEPAYFETSAAPTPVATTEPATNVTATTATLNGTVNPSGEGATFSFNSGISNGSSTVLGTVDDGATGAQATLISEHYQMTGLEPGTVYDYDIEIASAYGTSIGGLVVFLTLGIPIALNPPLPIETLRIPDIPFPKATTSKPSKKKKRKKSKTKKAHKAKHGSNLKKKQTGRKR